MKLFAFILGLCLAACSTAQAGSSGCSNVSSVSWYQANPYYSASSSQCILEVSQADAGTLASSASLYLSIPAGASDGDQFTVKDTSSYSTDVCDTYFDDPAWGGDGATYSYCQPGGYTLAPSGSALIGDGDLGYAQSLTDAEFYYTSIKNADGSDREIDPAYARRRYQITATYNASTGNWDAVRSAQ